MKKKFLSALLVAAMCVTTLAGCGGKEESTEKKASDNGKKGEVVLTVWSPQEDQSDDSGNWLKKSCEAFAKDYKDADLKFEYAVCPEGDTLTKVGQDPEKAADVYMFANDQVAGLNAANGIAKLGGKVADEVKKTNAKNIVDSITLDDSIYGVPFTSNTWFMYYNKDMFTEDDVKNLDTMLKKGKVAFPVTNAWFSPAFFYATGCTLFGESGMDEKDGVQFGGQKGADATNYLVDFVKNPNFVNDQDGSGLSGLRDGSIGAMFSGSWDYDAISEALGDKMGVCKLPTITIDGQEKQLRSFAGSKAIGVNPNCKNMQAAVQLASYLGSEKAQKDHYDLRKVIPCNIETLKDEKIANDPVVKAQNDTISETSVMQPFVSKMGNFWDPMANFGISITTGEVTHDNALEMADKLSESCNKAVAE